MAHLRKSSATGHLLKNSGGHLVTSCASLSYEKCADLPAHWKEQYCSAAAECDYLAVGGSINCDKLHYYGHNPQDIYFQSGCECETGGTVKVGIDFAACELSSMSCSGGLITVVCRIHYRYTYGWEVYASGTDPVYGYFCCMHGCSEYSRSTNMPRGTFTCPISSWGQDPLTLTPVSAAGEFTGRSNGGATCGPGAYVCDVESLLNRNGFYRPFHDLCPGPFGTASTYLSISWMTLTLSGFSEEGCCT